MSTHTHACIYTCTHLFVYWLEPFYENLSVVKISFLKLITFSLDLDKWINEPPESGDEGKGDDHFFFAGPSTSKYEDASPVCDVM